jgi:hypothetical protein
MTGSGGASSTPRPIVSIIGVSGILDHPPARVMTTEYDFTIPRRDTPEVLLKRRPSKEGAGNAGCALHPRSRVQNCAKNRTRAYRFSGGNPASPAQWLYGLCLCSPRRRIPLVTVAAGLMAFPIRLDRISHRQLDTSNGCQNHGVLPYALAPFVLRAVNRSRI